MYVFLCNLKPHSFNKRHKEKYKEHYKSELQKAFYKYNFEVSPLEGNLYGVVYYFHNVLTQLDADNISKPIWDALEAVVYSDDKEIKLRIAGVFDLISESIETLKIPQSVLDDFLGMIDEGKEHILYVEIGSLDYSLFKFEYEINLNEV
jgi:Holliday junction resolvase RusA-like endonuclease